MLVTVRKLSPNQLFLRKTGFWNFFQDFLLICLIVISWDALGAQTQKVEKIETSQVFHLSPDEDLQAKDLLAESSKNVKVIEEVYRKTWDTSRSKKPKKKRKPKAKEIIKDQSASETVESIADAKNDTEEEEEDATATKNKSKDDTEAAETMYAGGGHGHSKGNGVKKGGSYQGNQKHSQGQYGGKS